MNAKQKTLTVIAVIAVGIWAFILSDGNKLDAAMIGGLLFIIVAWVGLFFVFK